MKTEHLDERTEKQELLLKQFEFFNRLPESEKRHLLDAAVYRRIPAGTIMVEENGSCSGVTFVLSGEFKVYSVSENGREISLYSITAGETCVMTIACILGFNSSRSPASVVSVQDSVVAVLPADRFRYIYSQSPYMQQFIFRDILDKFYDILKLVERLTFKNVNERLRDYLTEKTAGGKKPVYATHAQLAARLGTSREVVTRKLRSLESEGIVRTERGKITLLIPETVGRQ